MYSRVMNICASISPLEMRLNEAHGNIKRTGGGGADIHIKEYSLSSLVLCSKRNLGHFRKIILSVVDLCATSLLRLNEKRDSNSISKSKDASLEAIEQGCVADSKYDIQLKKYSRC